MKSGNKRAVRSSAIYFLAMSAITSVAEAFFHACETAKGRWACSTYCMTDARYKVKSFAADSTRSNVAADLGWA